MLSGALTEWSPAFGESGQIVHEPVNESGTVTPLANVTCWDIAHHLWGNPIWPFMPSSAFGCMIFDSMIAPWFLVGAPSFLKRPHAAMRAAGA